MELSRTFWNSQSPLVLIRILLDLVSSSPFPYPLPLFFCPRTAKTRSGDEIKDNYDWLIDWLINWLIGWLIDWLIGWLIDWLIGWLFGWLIGWLVDWLIGWLIDWYITYIIFQVLPAGLFSNLFTTNARFGGLRVLARPLQAVHNVFFVWDIKLCPQVTVHNTGISLLLSTSVWVLLSPPIEQLVGWLIDWLVDWLVSWLVYWLIDWLIDRWFFWRSSDSHNLHEMSWFLTR